MQPVEIAAGRLCLRPFRSSDVEAVVRACQDPEIVRYTSVPTPYGQAEGRQYVENFCPSGWATGRCATFAVADAASDGLLASVCLDRIGAVDPRMAEVGYWTVPWARGGGVATEAVGVACRWGFTTFDLARIEWYAEVGNVASRRVAEKAGFVVEGTLRSRVTHRGRRVDAWVGSLLDR